MWRRRRRRCKCGIGHGPSSGISVLGRLFHVKRSYWRRLWASRTRLIVIVAYLFVLVS